MLLQMMNKQNASQLSDHVHKKSTAIQISEVPENKKVSGQGLPRRYREIAKAVLLPTGLLKTLLVIITKK